MTSLGLLMLASWALLVGLFALGITVAVTADAELPSPASKYTYATIHYEGTLKDAGNFGVCANQSLQYMRPRPTLMFHSMQSTCWQYT
jgi:hypothetical protein